MMMVLVEAISVFQIEEVSAFRAVEVSIDWRTIAFAHLSDKVLTAISPVNRL